MSETAVKYMIWRVECGNCDDVDDHEGEPSITDLCPACGEPYGEFSGGPE